jgi:hypothetical protein
MDKEFISYAQSKSLKELGFNEPCLGYYWNNKDFEEPEFVLTHCENVMDGNVKRPLYQQVFRWFNDVYLYDVTFGIKKEFNIHIREFRFFKSCEYSNKVESEDACIDKLIEIVKSL